MYYNVKYNFKVTSQTVTFHGAINIEKIHTLEHYEAKGVTPSEFIFAVCNTVADHVLGSQVDQLILNFVATESNPVGFAASTQFYNDSLVLTFGDNCQAHAYLDDGLVNHTYYYDGPKLLPVPDGIPFYDLDEEEEKADGEILKEWIKEAQSEAEEASEPVTESEDIHSYNVGGSDYAKHKIQPWQIWLEYKLNPWDADIIKRVLRKKPSDGRRLDYEKIIHVCKERIRQIDEYGE